MATVDILVIATAVVIYGLVSHRLDRWWVTMPMVFVAFGALTEASGAVDLELAIEEVAVLAEITLAVILFGDAVRMNVGRVRSDALLPSRLLLIGLPLTIAIGALVNWWILPGISIAAAALIASVLAPTDAALGEAIVSDPSVPVRIRNALNTEAGLNDGLALPAVLLFIDLERGALDTERQWVTFLLRQIGGGVMVGIGVGAGLAWLAVVAYRRNWIEAPYGQLLTLAAAASTFLLAGELGTNQFIAAFVGGLAFGSVMDDDLADHVDEYTAETGVLLATVAFFTFGNLFVSEALNSLTWQIAICAVLLLTVCRMVPVLVATAGMGLRRPTVAFLGWFGPRGLASIVFGILLLEQEDFPIGQELFDVVALVVVLSVFIHGLTASPGAAAYGRWYAHRDDPSSMSEGLDVTMRRLRRPLGRRPAR